MKGSIRNIFAACLAAVTALSITACGGVEPDSNLMVEEAEEEKVVNLFACL